jgi:alpha-glucosidase
MADFGYDVQNYTDVDPIFGDIHDIETLIAEAHAHSIKVILDFVPNHTSDEHPWFIESKSSLTNPKRNWYTWHEPNPDSSPPNNWLSVFGGPAWELSPETGQYYLHSFLAKQPDLNWDNPEVRQAMQQVMRFWLDKGIDGFRMDAIDWLSKDPDLRDDPVDENATGKKAGFDHASLRHTHSRDGIHLYERLNEMAEVLTDYTDKFMITEAHPETTDKITGYLRYYQGVNPYLSAPFNFEGIYLPWEAPRFRAFVDSFQSVMQSGYTPIYTVGNHDEARIASRIGPAAARTAALMLLTLPGMAFIYYGEELGMHDVPIPPEQVRDPFTGAHHGRDPERTPMQWDASPHAGFSTAEPWLPVADDYQQINVAAEAADPASSLSLYKQLIRLRRQSKALSQGSYQSIDTLPGVFSYKRTYGTTELLVLLNFTADPQQVTIAGLDGTVVLSTHLDAESAAPHEQVALRPHEGMIIQVQA